MLLLFRAIRYITLKTDVINLVWGFNDDIGDAMINLVSVGFLRNLEIKYILGKTLLSSLTLNLKYSCKYSGFWSILNWSLQVIIYLDDYCILCVPILLMHHLDLLQVFFVSSTIQKRLQIAATFLLTLPIETTTNRSCISGKYLFKEVSQTITKVSLH